MPQNCSIRIVEPVTSQSGKRDPKARATAKALNLASFLEFNFG